MDIVPFPEGRKMRPILLMLFLLLLPAAPFVQAAEFNVAVTRWDSEGVLSGSEPDSFLFSLKTGERANWSVANVNRTKMDILLLPEEQYRRAAAGLDFSFIPTASSVNTSVGTNRRYDHPGSFAILVRRPVNASGSAAYTISITLHRAPAPVSGGLTAGTVVNVILGAIILVGVGGSLSLFHLFFAVKGLASLRGSSSPAYNCPDCGGRLKYDAVMERWFCARERRWL
jgi:hypothetical protein